jgi:hypothetical protein
MDLSDSIRIYGVHILHGVEAVILRGNINVIHVEEDAAVRGVNDLVEKLPLRHL